MKDSEEESLFATKEHKKHKSIFKRPTSTQNKKTNTPNKNMNIKQTLQTLPIRLALFGAAAFLTHATSAQTWQTVDDFQYVAGRPTFAAAVTLDPFGNLFVAGIGDANSVFHALIEKSSDGGANWSTADDFLVATSARNTTYLGIASDAVGNLYAVGRFSVGDGNQWLTRQSMDAGATWSTVDTLSPNGGQEMAMGAATDSAGNAYVVGWTSTPSTTITTNKNGSTTTNATVTSTWLVRKGTETGTSWSTVDAFSLGGYGNANAGFCHPTQGIFVTGGSGSGTKVWTTRRSLDGGSTWTTVDHSIYGEGESIGGDASGNLYVAGYSGSHWIVRKSSNGGTAWATVDDFLGCVTVTSSTKPFKTSTQCALYGGAFGFAADAQGNLFVAGYVVPSSGGEQWVVRENPGGTGTWQTVDTFQYVPGRSTSARGIAADASGTVYVVGAGPDANGVSHWIVRKN